MLIDFVSLQGHPPPGQGQSQGEGEGESGAETPRVVAWEVQNRGAGERLGMW